MEMVLSLLAVGVATMTIFVYLAFIWWLDRYEREPLWLVGVAFAWGAIGGTCFGCTISTTLSSFAVEILGADIASTFTTVVIAPVIEEITKGLIFVPLFFSKHFDNETDGLIYGAAAGLGFAAVENIVYYSSANGVEELVTLAVLRTVFTALVHCISSALLGVAFGFAKHRAGALSALAIVFVGYCLAVLNHGTWNGIATATGFVNESASSALLLIGAVIVMSGALVMFLLTQFSLLREHRALARILKNEAGLGTLPLAHADIVPFWRRRFRSGWLPSHVNKKLYVKLVTLLAFRVHQAEVAGERAKVEGQQEIVDLRRRIQKLLGGTP